MSTYITTYIGFTENEFKTRYNGHVDSFLFSLTINQLKDITHAVHDICDIVKQKNDRDGEKKRKTERK